METQAFYRTLRERVGQCDREEAKRGTAAVFHALRDRVLPQEADQVVAQLPRPLKAVWEMGDKVDRQPVKMHREEFYDPDQHRHRRLPLVAGFGGRGRPHEARTAGAS